MKVNIQAPSTLPTITTTVKSCTGTFKPIMPEYFTGDADDISDHGRKNDDRKTNHGRKTRPFYSHRAGISRNPRKCTLTKCIEYPYKRDEGV